MTGGDAGDGEKPKNPAVETANTQPAPGRSGPAAASGWNAADLPVVDPNRYEIAGEFARGGMGRIVSARDRRLGRPVALKELLNLEADPSARFVREALVTARLQHPAIVPVYEAGRWPSGEPFYAMKMVSGRPLNSVMEMAQTLPERLALLPNVTLVAEAIAYAHSEQIIHRDLKPANILVGSFGETVVIDWGLAKDLSEAAAAEPARAARVRTGEQSLDGETIAGSVMGTPAYMPPEQARGEPVDARSDVYALGAILYHLLCGLPPYAGDSVDDVLDAVVAGPPPALERRAPEVPVELVTIVRTAMAREAVDRYPTAKELAEELRRFQTGQLIAAHDYSRIALLRRWLRRNRAPVLVASVLLAVLAVTAVVSLRKIVRESHAAEAARLNAEVESNQLTLLQARASLQHDPTAAIAWLKRLSIASPGWQAARVIAGDALSRGVARWIIGGHEGGVTLVRFLPGDQVVSAGEDGHAWLWDLDTGHGRPLGGPDEVVQNVAVSADGKRLASASNRRSARTVWLWDLGAEPRPSKLGQHEAYINLLAFSPDGRVVASAAWDHSLILWDGKTSRALVGHEGTIAALAFSADGQWLVSGGHDNTVRLWNVATGEGRLLGKHDGSVADVAFSPDGKTVASASTDHSVRLWNLASGDVRVLGSHDDAVLDVAFSPDGHTLASAGHDRTVRLWSLNGGPTRVLTGHEDAVLHVTFAPDGRRLASASADKTVRIWELDTGDSQILAGHDSAVADVAFSRDGKRVASASDDGTVRIWDTKNDTVLVLRGHDGPVRAIAAAPDGRTVVSASEDRTVRLWSLSSGGGRVLGRHDGAVNDVAFSPGGRMVASVGDDKLVRLFDLYVGGGARALTGHTAPILCVAFSPDDHQLATGGVDQTVRVWDLATGSSRALEDAGGEVRQLLFTPDGLLVARVVLSGGAGLIRVYKMDSGESKVIDSAERGANRIALSADGRILAAASPDGTVHLWELGTDRSELLRGHTDAVRDIAFSPDGRALVSGSDDHTLRLWQVATGKGIVLRGHTGGVRRVVFSADGRRILSASSDHTARLWDVDSHESRALRGHTDVVDDIAFSRDGQRLVTTGRDGTLRVFLDDLSAAPRALRTGLAASTHVVIGPDDRPSSP